MNRHYLVKLALLWVIFGAAQVLADESRPADYKPLFSKEMLEKADPATRERLQALDARNYKRWLDQRRPPRSSQGSAGGGVRVSAPKPTGSGGQGTLYRYTDAQGKVRFTDQYVQGAKEVSVAARKPSQASRAEHEARQKEQARMLQYYSQRDAQQREEELEQERRRAKQTEFDQRCKQLFLDIQDNRRGGFVSYDVGPNGERVFISDEELSARTDDMEARYRKHCGKLPSIGR
ncbi:MAG: DUF4124 domain-containing protein [Pseudomonadales bacterium]